MIYITGDTHGELLKPNVVNLRKLKKHDYVIITGDFGFIWNGNAEEEKKLKKLTKLKCNILFVDGCHENFEILKSYKKEYFFNNEVLKIRNNIYMLLRGNVYEIDNKSFLAFGGGLSEDAEIRMEVNTYDERELITKENIENSLKNLNTYNFKVDYVVSHIAPTNIKEFLDINNNFSTSYSNNVLQKISENLEFKKWFFGHYHIDKEITSKYVALYNRIYKITS